MQMSANQWQVIYHIVTTILAVIFFICLVEHWDKVAWFVVFPIGLISNIVLWRKKNSN
jgi:hypothetical protein